MSLYIKEHIPLAPYTVYQIGGPARFFVDARNAGELEEAVRFAAERKIRFFILGAGSNVLISDNGFDGLVIRMVGGEISVDGERIVADAGVRMASAVARSAKERLTGFEWAIGIPGTIGGSVRGNAGCFGGEMRDVVEKVSIFDINTAKSYTLNALRCRFRYRDSIFKRRPEWIIFSATLALKRGDAKKIQTEIRRISGERSAHQDIGAQSCGCIFKNVVWPHRNEEKEMLLKKFPELSRFEERETIPAAFLIESVGLKGYARGRVEISRRHANFFLNTGGATAENVRFLIQYAKEAVRRKYGVCLEEEIQYLGF